MPRARNLLTPYRTSSVNIVLNGRDIHSAHAALSDARPELASQQATSEGFRIEIHMLHGGRITVGDSDDTVTENAPFGTSTLYILSSPARVDSVYATRELAQAALNDRVTSGHGAGYVITTERLQGGVIVLGKSDKYEEPIKERNARAKPSTASDTNSHKALILTNSHERRKKDEDEDEGGAGGSGNVGVSFPGLSGAGSQAKRGVQA